MGGQIRSHLFHRKLPRFLRSIISKGKGIVNKIYDHAKDLGAKIDEFDEIQKYKTSTDESEKYGKLMITYINLEAVIRLQVLNIDHFLFPEEKKYHGNGIHHCELCDGEFYQDKDIIVVEVEIQLQGAIFLSRYAKRI